ncbi:MAG TPA: 50S ribosomal protein L20 [Anaerolineae bacterium]|nr:50S ribosomal protein L20 [Anaerolineae bacterium]HQK15135.1 50S ribosomal protein L20 [Anaerolineae bacterium]
MVRVKAGTVTRRRHKKIVSQTKGFYGTRRKLFRRANEAWMKSMVYAYRDRRSRKRDLRRLWIIRINAAAHDNGVSYSRLMNDLKKANIAIDRKMLADLAVNNPTAFAAVVRAAVQA